MTRTSHRPRPGPRGPRGPHFRTYSDSQFRSTLLQRTSTCNLNTVPHFHISTFSHFHIFLTSAARLSLAFALRAKVPHFTFLRTLFITTPSEGQSSYHAELLTLLYLLHTRSCEARTRRKFHFSFFFTVPGTTFPVPVPVPTSPQTVPFIATRNQPRVNRHTSLDHP